MVLLEHVYVMQVLIVRLDLQVIFLVLHVQGGYTLSVKVRGVNIQVQLVQQVHLLTLLLVVVKFVLQIIGHLLDLLLVPYVQ